MWLTRRNPDRLAAIWAAAFVFSAPAAFAQGAPAGAPAPSPGHDTALLEGRATTKTAGELRAYTVTDSAALCGSAKEIAPVVIGSGMTLAYAVIAVHGVPKAGEPVDAVIKQERCEFVPRTTALAAGARLGLINADRGLHSVHATLLGDPSKPLFHRAFPRQTTKPYYLPMTKAGILRLQCDAKHPWETGYVYVHTNAFVTVTGTDGTYRIKGLPPGEYNVTAWHANLGEQNTKLTFTPGEATVWNPGF